MRYGPGRVRRDACGLLCFSVLALAGIAPLSSQPAESNQSGAAARDSAALQSSAEAPKNGRADDMAPRSNHAVPFEMSAVERLRLRVLDHPDLTGEYRVDSDATISLPGVGRIDVGGMTPEVMEKELAKRISSYARRDLAVSIEIERFKPYFIVGMIVEPGATEWRPGLNVVKAIALARGTTRAPMAADDPVSGLAVQQSETQLQFSLALLARLKAERDGDIAVATSERTASIIAGMPVSLQPRLKEFLARQDSILDERRELLKNQIAGYERERQTAQNELDAAQRQEKAIKTQLDISTSLLNDVEHLKDQKLVSNSRYLTQRSELITSQIRHAEAQSLVERARARLDTASRQIETVHGERKAALNERIEVLQREVAQLEVSLLAGNSGGSGTRQFSSNLSYHIARESSTGIVTSEATVFSEIMPGDVLVVSRERPGEESVAGSAEMTSADVTGAAGDIQSAIESSSVAQGQAAGRAGTAGAPTPR